ncbi:Leucine-rich alpha-2-glycoprotein [Merluccius polli]|uniref:Leucine-rich alpha-2-glycoprotein n=1 Tax=Merluccius polli TaxID=89951 RepID=A0AA47M4Y9_MERPO|nr:Leucine-rich alpha-2-glycoprotein [Merluccius polli]
MGTDGVNIRLSLTAVHLFSDTMASRLTLALLCLTLLGPRSTLACPALCKCYPRRAEVVCSEVPLTEFPSEGLPANTTMLTIQYTNITTVSKHHLSATPLLEGLHLYNNHLRSLPPNVLRGVPRLLTLDLTGNRLADLPADVFRHAPLTTLVLKNNLMETAKAEWLPDDSSLTWLDLSWNRLTGVPAALFKKLPHLESLDLSHNRLEKIPAKSLDTLTKLERLNLQRNKLVSLDPLLFHNTVNITNLYLTANRLDKLSPSLFQGLGKLSVLGLEDNQLGHVPPGLFDPLTSLDEQGLDLTANPWLCDQKVEYLWSWLQQNKGKAFLAETIRCAMPLPLAGHSVLSLLQSKMISVFKEPLHWLGFVYLLQHFLPTQHRPSKPSRTRNKTTEGTKQVNRAIHLTKIWGNGFKILLHFLLVLVVLKDYACHDCLASRSCPAHCECTLSICSTGVVCNQGNLSYFPVDGLPNSTTRLSIQSTNLSAIAADDLRTVPHLVYLQLYHSNLETLPSHFLKDVPHLNTLDLTGNRLAYLPPNALHHAPLRNVILKDNRIEIVHPDWFPANSNVTFMDLSGNHLTEVNSSMFRNLPNLKNLDLSDNNLEELQADTLRHLHHLVSLNLVNNRISTLTPGTFASTPKLTRLYLQQNLLQELDPDLFQSLPHLELLLLDQNRLQSLPFGLLGNFSSPEDKRGGLVKVFLTGNPWVCDEGIKYLWRWVTAFPQKVGFPADMVCASPKALENRMIASLNEKELGSSLNRKHYVTEDKTNHNREYQPGKKHLKTARNLCGGAWPSDLWAVRPWLEESSLMICLASCRPTHPTTVVEIKHSN